MREQLEEHIAKEMLKAIIDNSPCNQRTKDNTKFLIESSRTEVEVVMSLIVGSWL